MTQPVLVERLAALDIVIHACAGKDSAMSSSSGSSSRMLERVALGRPGSPSHLQAPLIWAAPRQHFLYFFPLPQGQGSLRPNFGALAWESCAGDAHGRNP